MRAPFFLERRHLQCGPVIAKNILSRVGKRPRSLVRDATLVAALLLYEPNAVWIAAGLGVFALGCAMHFWSKGVLTRNWELTTTGPYRFVRNPFYLGNILIDSGICILAESAVLLLIYVPVSLLVYFHTIRSEEQFLGETHREQFDAYVKRVPALFSWRINRLFGPTGFSWSIIEQEQEIPRLLRILAIPSYFLMVHAAFHSPQPPALRAVMFSGGAVLALGLHLASRWARRRNQRAFLLGY